MRNTEVIGKSICQERIAEDRQEPTQTVVYEAPPLPEVSVTPRYTDMIWDFHGTMTDHQLRLIRTYHRVGRAALGRNFERQVYQDALTRPSKQADKHANLSREEARSQSNREYLEELWGGQYDENVRRDFRLAYGDRNGTYLAGLHRDIAGLTAYKDSMDSTYMPIPGIRGVVKQLLAGGVNIVVLTNGTQREIILKTLEEWGLSELSDRLYSKHLTGFKKPDRRTVDHIVKEQQQHGKFQDPNRTLIIGDYIDDIRTADNMGMDSVLIVRGNGWEKVKVKEPRPTYITSSARDIIKIVNGDFQRETRDEVMITPALWQNETWGPQNNIME